MTMAMTIRNVRPWGGEPSDVVMADGVITAVRPHDPAAAVDGDQRDGHGRLLLPSFSDVHVHLDSSRLGLPFRPHTGTPGIWNLVMNDRRHWREAEWSMERRATHALGMLIVNGTTRVRSYAQVDVDCRLERFEAVLAAKQTHRTRCEVQVVAFPQAGLLREAGTVDLVERALRDGADVIGGIDPCQLDRDPVRHLDVVFGLAEKYRVPVDIHLHEPGELAVWTTELILERTRALSMAGNVSISHGYELGGVSESTTARLIDQFADLDIALTTVAPSRDTCLPLERLTAAGVRVGLGQDGQRDYWSPYGNGDMLSRTWQLAFTNRYRRDELIEHCLAVASIGGASVMGRSARRLGSVGDRPGTAVGDPAELLLVPGECVTAAIMDRPGDRTVIHQGRVVADAATLAG
jgi:cytosine/adenosine deaminase-related metal-dependent hydrolase